jgi:hypothetical protein
LDEGIGDTFLRQGQCGPGEITGVHPET